MMQATVEFRPGDIGEGSGATEQLGEDHGAEAAAEGAEEVAARTDAGAVGVGGGHLKS
jgi:hypothetical protein